MGEGAGGRSVLGVLAALATIGVLGAASVTALGAPAPGLAAQFLTGSYPTLGEAVALCSLICYAVVAVIAVVMLAGVLAGVLGRGAGPGPRGRSLRGVALVIAGAALLGLSLAARAETGQTICCGGGPQQVREVASLAR